MSEWTQPKDKHQLLADKLGIELRGPGDLPCLGCEHQFRGHEGAPRTADAGKCAECECQAFVWEHIEEDPDALWDAHKAGYVNEHGEYLEPDAPEGL